MFGRKVIYSDATEVNEGNIANILQRQWLPTPPTGRTWNIYTGTIKATSLSLQIKDVRPEINNKIVENRANEIVSFKVGYLMGEPVQYVSRVADEKIAEMVTKLNDYVLSEDKPAKDKELADWFHICGTAYRMVMPDTPEDEDEAPFEIYTLDPGFALWCIPCSWEILPHGGQVCQDGRWDSRFQLLHERPFL